MSLALFGRMSKRPSTFEALQGLFATLDLSRSVISHDVADAVEIEFGHRITWYFYIWQGKSLEHVHSSSAD
jgi:hypothetical protein